MHLIFKEDADLAAGVNPLVRPERQLLVAPIRVGRQRGQRRLHAAPVLSATQACALGFGVRDLRPGSA